MAGWISSKLKVAENLLQQIDQQAAESLRKNEQSSLSVDRLNYDDGVSKNGTSPSSPSIATTDSVPLRLQINKKPTRFTRPQDSRRSSVDTGHDSNRNVQSKVPDSGSRVPPKSAVKVEDDWTELLGAAPTRTKSGGVALERQRSARGLGVVEKRSGVAVDVVVERKSNASVGDGSLRKLSSPRSDADESGKGAGKDDVASRDGLGGAERISEVLGVDIDVSGSGSGSGSVAKGEDVITSEVLNANDEMDADGGEIRKLEETYRSSTTVGSSAPYGSPESSERSDSESETESSSDSGNDRESREERRRRRERMIAEKAAAMAAEAIKERENVVARLEGEKQSLEKILEERKKQQAEEASELQISMMETMEAVDLEKQRHNSTRMEAWALLAALESTNAELAKSLATTQWSLETEVNQVADLHQQIEFKKLAHEALKRKMGKLQSSSSLKKEKLKGTEYERGMLEAEYSFLCDKVLQLKEKAKKLEDNIEMTKKEMLQPTQVEIELKGRLDQLTDHLIQEQTQVETLSAEKAMLLFKIESISRFLHDGGLSSNSDDVAVDLGASSARIDVEAGSWDPSYKSSAARFSRIRAAESHLLSFIRQMDALFSVGVSLLRRNPNARLWSVIYLLLLHIWVFYVFTSHSKPADTGGSGAIFSLENINKTGP